MKKPGQSIEEMIMQSHYRSALEIESRAEKGLADMERQGYIDTIKGLQATIESLQTSLDTLKESVESGNKMLMLTINDLTNKVSAQQTLIEQLTKERDDLKAMLNRENQNRYATTSCSQKTRKNNHKKDNDRQKDKDDFVSSKEEDEKKPDDGQNNAGESQDEEGLDRTKVKSESLSEGRGERGKYNQMSAAKTVTLETSLEGAPTHMKFVGYKDIEEYHKVSYVECTIFKVAVYEDEYGNRHEYYKPKEEGDTRMPRLNVIPGTHATPELLADLVVEHKMLFVPVYRERIRHILDKFQVSKNTDRNWLKIGAKMLSPILSLLKEKLLKNKSVLNIDETWVKIRIKFMGDGTKLGKYTKKYIWVLVNKIEGITYFFYDNAENDSRGSRPILEFLGDFIGSIQSDGYIVYKMLAGLLPEDEHLMCWCHVRNKYEQVFRACKDKNADWFVQMIGHLYRIEAECNLLHMTAEERKKRRNMPDVDKILKVLYQKGTEMLSQKRKHYSEMMRKALRYMVDNFDDLTKYRNDGRYSIDNLIAYPNFSFIPTFGGLYSNRLIS